MLTIIIYFGLFLLIGKLIKLTEDGWFGLFFTMMIIFIIGICITDYPPTREVTYKEVQLVNIKSQTDIRCSFFLGTGTIEGEPYYYYYYKTKEGGFKQDKVRAKEVTIYENDTIKPKIIYTTTEMYLNWTKYPWLFFIKIPETKINIYIPKNSIYRGFKLN